MSKATLLTVFNPNKPLRPLLYWKQEGAHIKTYWDANMTKPQTSYLIGEACTKPEKIYEVGLTFDLRVILGITEQVINAWGFATAVPIRTLKNS